MLLAEHLDESPVIANDIKVWTQQDQMLARVLYTQQGWPDPAILISLSWTFQLCGKTHIVITTPGSARAAWGHPGMMRMNRMYIWWPWITADIEKYSAMIVNKYSLHLHLLYYICWNG